MPWRYIKLTLVSQMEARKQNYGISSLKNIFKNYFHKGSVPVKRVCVITGTFPCTSCYKPTGWEKLVAPPPTAHQVLPLCADGAVHRGSACCRRHRLTVTLPPPHVTPPLLRPESWGWGMRAKTDARGSLSRVMSCGFFQQDVPGRSLTHSKCE